MTSLRVATLLEQRMFLSKWHCVCAECRLCKLILDLDWEDEEE